MAKVALLENAMTPQSEYLASVVYALSTLLTARHRIVSVRTGEVGTLLEETCRAALVVGRIPVEILAQQIFDELDHRGLIEWDKSSYCMRTVPRRR